MLISPDSRRRLSSIRFGGRQIDELSEWNGVKISETEHENDLKLSPPEPGADAAL